jgi:hypothetical protein
MALSDLARQFSAYWGVIRSNAFSRATTTVLWQAIANFEQTYNLVRQQGLFKAVTEMRALAVAQRNAAEAFASADPTDAIDSSMIAEDINSRPVTERSLAPKYLVKFEANVVTEEGPDTRWMTVTTNDLGGMMKADLLDQIDQAGLDMSTGCGALYTGLTGDLQIVAV